MKINLLAVVAFLAAIFATATTSAQAVECDTRSGEGCYPSSTPSATESHEAEFLGDRALMTAALLQKLTIWTRPADGRRIYVQHCRRLRHGCEREVSVLVDYIFDVSIREGFDPWLLAAVAWHESRFNPFAESNQGAFGVLQMLRRSRWSHGLPFVRQRWYRERCRRELGSCQRPIVERSVYWLKRSIDHCGSVQAGLRMYNSGRCDGPRRYPRAVFAAQRDILNRARVIAENNFVDPTSPSSAPVYVDDDEPFCSHTGDPLCEEPTLEEYWCSTRSLMCESEGIRCQCRGRLLDES